MWLPLAFLLVFLPLLLLTNLVVVGESADASSKKARNPDNLTHDKRSGSTQNVFTWDQHSLLINNERMMIFSGEFHPFRHPVPGLRLDVFQKFKSRGFNDVSFYTAMSVNNLGPQAEFPVPEGVLNYNGINQVAVTLWGLDERAVLGPSCLQLVALHPLWSGYRKPVAVDWPRYVEREGAY